MNSVDIYTVLLSKEYPITGRDYPLLGFSYQLQRENGEVKLIEFGHTTRIVLWNKDGPELFDLTEEQVKERIEQVLSK